MSEGEFQIWMQHRVAFWWLIFVLFITGGVAWFIEDIPVGHWRHVRGVFLALHVGAGIGLFGDVIYELISSWRRR